MCWLCLNLIYTFNKICKIDCHKAINEIGKLNYNTKLLLHIKIYKNIYSTFTITYLFCSFLGVISLNNLVKLFYYVLYSSGLECSILILFYSYYLNFIWPVFQLENKYFYIISYLMCIGNTVCCLLYFILLVLRYSNVNDESVFSFGTVLYNVVDLIRYNCEILFSKYCHDDNCAIFESKLVNFYYYNFNLILLCHLFILLRFVALMNIIIKNFSFIYLGFNLISLMYNNWVLYRNKHNSSATLFLFPNG